jgi:uncharacterized protein (TIGR02246 family)
MSRKYLTMFIGFMLMSAAHQTLSAQEQEYASPELKAAIAEANETWQAGWNAADAAAIGSAYADDAIVMPPGAEPIEGREAFQAVLVGLLEAAEGSQMAFGSPEIMVYGEVAIEVGSFVETAADGSHKDHGRYMTVLKNIDGHWKIVRDIWNSSMTP